jgi:glycosyltransferase involved in cell wall biosynthesis/GT2 family glycosyltransferase
MEKTPKNYLSLVPPSRSPQGSTEEGTSQSSVPSGDFIAKGLSVVLPDSCFPNMIIGDKASHPWPYLRREIDHNWYCDRRAPHVGFLNRDEAVLLHNLALQFRDKPGLEIGCWKGWSTCHLALAGMVLDVVDPILAEEENLECVRDSLGAAGVLGNVRLYAAASPDAVRDLARLSSVKWNFFFIDGDHEGVAPARDAAECIEHAAADAMVVFHSLTSPAVEQGLQVLWRKGWNVLIYQTMQIMGVAWRGSVKPVAHQADPSINWTLPLHLAKYPVSGESAEEVANRLSRGMAWFHQENSRVQDECVSLRGSLEKFRSEIAARDREIESLRAAVSASDAELKLQRDASPPSHQKQLALHLSRISEKEMHIQRLFFEVQKFTDEIGRLSPVLGDVLPDYQAVVSSTLWKMTQPMRRLRASRFAPKINMMLLGLACRILKSVRQGESTGNSVAVGVNQEQLALFDAAYYREMNPDVAQSGSDPFLHYVTHGAEEGRAPHPLFDTSFYYERNPHVKQMGLNPLLHYMNQGAAEGRDPHPLFSIWFYRESNPDVAQSGIDPLVHYLKRGAAEGRNPHPLFDTTFYFEMNPGVKEEGINPLVHYVTRGATEGRHPHPLFDSTFYYSMNPDVATAGINPLIHYLTVGAMKGRDPHPLFDTSFHVERNPDVAKAGINPLWHYVVFGAKEDRDPHPLFDTSFYREQKPQIRELGINPLVHFIKEGPTPEFDPLTPSPELPDTGICIVTPDIVGPVKNGGIGTACYHFARVLAEADHPVTILFSGELTDCQKAHWRNAYARFQIKFIALSDTPPVEKTVYGSTWFYERSWRIFEFLRMANYSVIHFQDWQANGFWSIKAKQVGLAFEHTLLTLMTHSSTKWINEGMQQFGVEPLETAKQVWAEAYCMEHCDALFSPSRYMVEWARENGIRLPEKTLLTPYVWCDKSEPGKRADIHVDNDHLIFFGRLETRKGLHIFCDAIRQLKSEGRSLPEKISFLGKCASVQGVHAADYLEFFRRDLPSIEIHIVNNFDYLQALSYIRKSKGLVVICSIVENYPLTVIESIQYKLPFLASAVGGIREMVNEQVSFEPTVDALANRLGSRWSIDHQDIRHKYSPGIAAKIWRELHAELMKGANQAAEVASSAAVDMKSSPSVSICIPYFNHPQYLETLVMAMARQTYPVFEVILVNDGSGQVAAAEFARIKRNSRDARFKFMNTENHGPGAARNYAVESSTGDLLLFFDADNLPKDNDFVSTLVRAIQSSKADCVTVPYDIVSPERILVSERDIVATYRPTGSCIEAGFFENVLGDATMIIKRATFESIGGFPTRRASWEDHELLLDLCFSGFKLETFPESVFYYRRSPTGRNQRVNEFHNYQSLFGRLRSAKSVDLARIIAAVGGPMLLTRSNRHPSDFS